MRKGFKFKGVHSNDMGITVRTKSRSVTPSVREALFTVPLGDGVINLSADNRYRRPFYEDRIFEAELNITAGGIDALERKLSKIAAWLMGSGDLIFDDMPEIVWKAHVIESLNFTPQRGGHKTVLTAAFRTEPFGYYFLGSADDVLLGLDMVLESPVYLDWSGEFTYSVSDESESLSVYNAGTHYVRPKIKISSGNDFSIDSVLHGDRKIIFNNCTGLRDIIIDCENQTITNSGGDNLMTYAEKAEFFELEPGKNELTVNTSGTALRTVFFDYIPRFIYHADFAAE